MPSGSALPFKDPKIFTIDCDSPCGDGIMVSGDFVSIPNFSKFK